MSPTIISFTTSLISLLTLRLIQLDKSCLRLSGSPSSRDITSPSCSATPASPDVVYFSWFKHFDRRNDTSTLSLINQMDLHRRGPRVYETVAAQTSRDQARPCYPSSHSNRASPNNDHDNDRGDGQPRRRISLAVSFPNFRKIVKSVSHRLRN